MFVIEALPSGGISAFLGNIFPINETSWEHMKMMWYPLLAAGIIWLTYYPGEGYVFLDNEGLA